MIILAACFYFLNKWLFESNFNIISALYSHPRILPEISSDGIPTDERTALVQTVLAGSKEEVQNALRLLEESYSNNADKNLIAIYLSAALDREVIEEEISIIKTLQSKYGPDKFYLFHRNNYYGENLLNFILSNQEVDTSPKEGKNTTTVTLTSKGSGNLDSEFSVQGGDPPNVIAKLSIKIHKPNKIINVDSESMPAKAGWVGKGRIFIYKIRDVQNRVIPDLGHYGFYERLHIDKNVDGLGGYFVGTDEKDLINEIRKDARYFPGSLISDGTIMIHDRVSLFVPDTTTIKDLGRNAKAEWHNSVYLIDICLKGSTYRYTFTPVFKKEKVTDLKLGRQQLNDSSQVASANDDID
jgi:hypothetical protein